MIYMGLFSVARINPGWVLHTWSRQLTHSHVDTKVSLNMHCYFQFYFTASFCWFVSQRVKEYLLGSSLVCKLQAKHDQLKVAVEKGIASVFLTNQHQKANCWPRVSFDNSCCIVWHHYQLNRFTVTCFQRLNIDPLIIPYCLALIYAGYFSSFSPPSWGVKWTSA